MKAFFDDVLAKRLKQYILARSESSVRIQKGYICLDDCHFSGPAIEDLFNCELGTVLPVEIALLHCKKLSISINPKLTGTGEVDVIADEISVVIRRRADTEVASQQLREMKEERVRAKMRELDGRTSEGGSSADPPKRKSSGGIFQSLLAATVDRVLRNMIGRLRPRLDISRVCAPHLAIS